MKCFGCGKVGHLVRACPDKNVSNGTEDESGSQSHNEGQSVEKETEIGEVSDLSVDNKEPGSSRMKSSEKQILKNDETMDIELEEMVGELLRG